MHPTLGFALSLLIVAGCMEGPEPVQSPKTANLTGKTTFPPDLGRGAPRAETDELMMYMPTEIQSVCVGMDPKFTYNSQSVEGADNKSLRALADCMKTGALAGKSIRLIGHADIRGSVTYNDALGKRRAEAVKMYLMKTGIPSERLLTDTVGKTGSSPPPENWDRRVDFELVTASIAGRAGGGDSPAATPMPATPAPATLHDGQ